MIYAALIALILIAIGAMFVLYNDIRDMIEDARALDDRADQVAHGDWPSVPSEKPPVFHATTPSRKGQR